MQKKSLGGLRKRLLKRLAEKKRKRKQLLEEYVRLLSNMYPKSLILLFGSRSRGEELPYSDYDLAVVLEEINDYIEETHRMRLLKPRGISVDLLALTVRDLEDPLIFKMLQDAIPIYNGLNLGWPPGRRAPPKKSSQ